MSEYDEMSAIGFFRGMTHRLDGKATLAVAVFFVAMGVVAPLINFSVGGLHGWTLSASALGLVPVLFIYYASLVYFSTSGTVSVLLNTALIAAVPVLFYYFA